MKFSKAAYKEKTCPVFDIYPKKHNRKKLNRLRCSVIQKCQMVNDRKDIGISLNNIIPEQQCSQQDFLSVAPQPISGLGRLIVEVSISLTDTHGRWDSLNEAATYTTNTRDEYPLPQRDSNPRSKQSDRCRPTPYNARSPEAALSRTCFTQNMWNMCITFCSPFICSEHSK